MRVCLGGTFDRFHAGHEALLRAAFAGADAVFVGVSEGALAARPGRTVAAWDERAGMVREFAARAGFAGELEVAPLRDPAGPAAAGVYDAIVVSPETAAGAARINDGRRRRGLPPLAVRVVPHVLGADRLPVSATAIAEGRIDRAGRRLRPVVVGAGSGNPVKLGAVEAEFAAFLPDAPLHVEPVAVASGVPEQPQGEQTLRGARTRAQAARAALTEADYWVGVEAGLVTFPGEAQPCDVQACVVLDRTGAETVGWGPGFHYPAWVTERALRGEMVSRILGPVANDPQIGGTTGAVGYLSEGRMDRTELTRVGLRMALLPRMRRDLYGPAPPPRP